MSATMFGTMDPGDVLAAPGVMLFAATAPFPAEAVPLLQSRR